MLVLLWGVQHAQCQAVGQCDDGIGEGRRMGFVPGRLQPGGQCLTDVLVDLPPDRGKAGVLRRVDGEGELRGGFGASFGVEV